MTKQQRKQQQKLINYAYLVFASFVLGRYFGRQSLRKELAAPAAPTGQSPR